MFALFIIQDYNPSALDQMNFAFDAPILESFSVSIPVAKSTNIQYDRFQSYSWIRIDAEANTNVANSVCSFLKNSKTGTCKDGLHGRDDQLMEVIFTIATLTPERNRNSDSTLAQTRPDGYLYNQGWPPVVIFEEKHQDSELDEARADITKKFRWLYHYHKLDFIIAIAIAGDTIEFSKISQHGRSSQTVFNLRNISDRFRFVCAVV